MVRRAHADKEGREGVERGKRGGDETLQGTMVFGYNKSWREANCRVKVGQGGGRVKKKTREKMKENNRPFL